MSCSKEAPREKSSEEAPKSKRFREKSFYLTPGNLRINALTNRLGKQGGLDKVEPYSLLLIVPYDTKWPFPRNEKRSGTANRLKSILDDVFNHVTAGVTISQICASVNVPLSCSGNAIFGKKRYDDFQQKIQQQERYLNIQTFVMSSEASSEHYWENMVQWITEKPLAGKHGGGAEQKYRQVVVCFLDDSKQENREMLLNKLRQAPLADDHPGVFWVTLLVNDPNKKHKGINHADTSTGNVKNTNIDTEVSDDEPYEMIPSEGQKKRRRVRFAAMSDEENHGENNEENHGEIHEEIHEEIHGDDNVICVSDDSQDNVRMDQSAQQNEFKDIKNWVLSVKLGQMMNKEVPKMALMELYNALGNMNLTIKLKGESFFGAVKDALQYYEEPGGVPFWLTKKSFEIRSHFDTESADDFLQTMNAFFDTVYGDACKNVDAKQQENMDSMISALIRTIREDHADKSKSRVFFYHLILKINVYCPLDADWITRMMQITKAKPVCDGKAKAVCDGKPAWLSALENKLNAPGESADKILLVSGNAEFSKAIKYIGTILQAKATGNDEVMKMKHGALQKEMKGFNLPEGLDIVLLSMFDKDLLNGS